MAQFRSTADIVDRVLLNAGEVTNGNSPYESQALDFVNRVHHTLIAGGTIPIGKDTSVQIDEVWPWSRTRLPLVLTLKPKYNTGSVSLTKGSESGTFSVAPSISLKGYHLKADSDDGWFKIASHSAGATAFELDGEWTNDTGSALSFRAVKIDYELIPEYIVIDSENNKLQFEETASTTLTSTLTSGTYSPSELAAEVQTQLNADGASTYTVSYDSVSKKFTIASNRSGGGGVFILKATGNQSRFSAHRDLGFDDADTSDAASITSTYILGGLSRIIEPIKIQRGSYFQGSVFGIDPESFQRDFPLSVVTETEPTRFCLIRETDEGVLTLRFNSYVPEETRIEIEGVKVPRDLKDNSSSIPLVPRKHVDVLEDAGTFYLMLLKSDDRAQTYAQLLQGKLQAMINQHRGAQNRQGKFFGQIVPRQENLDPTIRRRTRYGYDT